MGRVSNNVHVNMKVSDVSRQSVSEAELTAVHARSNTHFRLMSKTGQLNISTRHKPSVHRRYVSDMMGSLLTMNWAWVGALTVVSYVSSWVLFSLFWLGLAVAHGDYGRPANDTSWEPCVIGVVDWTSAVFFSIETQHTIGYGVRAPSRHCPQASVLLVIQSLIGVVITSLLAGLLFARCSMPTQRRHTIVFSRYAVVGCVDDTLVWQCRVGDIRQSHLIATSVRALFVSHHGKTSDSIGLHSAEMEVSTQGDFVLAGPLEIVHKVDKSSPLWKFTMKDNPAPAAADSFEIIVILEGFCQETSMITQSKTSYLPDEILWHHTFAPIGEYDLLHEKVIDYSNFDRVLKK